MQNCGKEIWDWAADVGAFIAKQNEINRVRKDLRELNTVCGDCNHWMKSSECPREKNINGRNHGPSMGDFICNKFVTSYSAIARKESLEKQLKELLA